MTRVYAIRTGEYSDTGWGPVFSTLERALAYKKQHGNRRNTDIEVHVLDDENDTGPVYPTWAVVFDRNGMVLKVHERSDPEPFEEPLHKPEVKLVPKDCRWYFLEDQPTAYLVVDNVMAPDTDHAIKVGSEQRFMFLSKNL